ncbi:hypothetical protein SLEP1_g41993 [Rubroshorea leprosula]|uniref:Uncharacterized protein n=1 Tax=Rubroshorea leprosula TaxID=152421 RepID=A0AAV5L8S4_9ROSI|nr:hypothetical protein SLEP1_g41993 [Rubroshorea leprosula]
MTQLKPQTYPFFSLSHLVEESQYLISFANAINFEGLSIASKGNVYETEKHGAK